MTKKQENPIQKDSLFKVEILFIRVASCAKRITCFFVSFNTVNTSSWFQTYITVLFIFSLSLSLDTVLFPYL